MRLRTIILAPDSFKESLSAASVAAAMARGVSRAAPSIITRQCPIGDGGEGTMDAIVAVQGGAWRTNGVTGPMWTPVLAKYALIDNRRTGVIELAQASGLGLVARERRDPTCSTSFGTGELIESASAAGCNEIIVCIGGSATADGGTGIAQACGFRFFEARDRVITVPMHGGALKRLARIERPTRAWPRMRVACDVTNPLCGPKGAAAVYGPQKGATPEQVTFLDAGLAHLGRIAGGDPDAPGAGAAGGAGYGLATFFNATLERGIDLVLEAVGFRDLCKDADLVITGEGRLDAQSLHGKACMGVARAAHELGVPTIAIVGSTGPGAEDCVNAAGGRLQEYVSLSQRFGHEAALRNVASRIADAAEELVLRLVG